MEAFLNHDLVWPEQELGRLLYHELDGRHHSRHRGKTGARGQGAPERRHIANLQGDLHAYNEEA